MKELDLSELQHIDKGLSTVKFLDNNSKTLHRVYLDNREDSHIRYQQEISSLSLINKLSSEKPMILGYPTIFGNGILNGGRYTSIKWMKGEVPKNLSKDALFSIWLEMNQDLSNLDLELLIKQNNINSLIHSDVLDQYINSVKPLNDGLLKEVTDFEEYRLFIDFCQSFETKLPSDLKLIHGDFHPNNILISQNSNIELNQFNSEYELSISEHPNENLTISIIDWEYGALGTPIYDLAYLICYDIGRYNNQPKDLSNYFKTWWDIIKSNTSSISSKSELNYWISVSTITMAVWFYKRYMIRGTKHNLSSCFQYFNASQQNWLK
jgi:thiamine kinase-like enzyme